MEPIKEFNQDIGIRIREVRETMRMTREEFSELCEISSSFLASVEGGRKSISSKTIYKICNATKISPDYIIYGKEEGHEADMVLEMLNTLDPKAKGHAVRMLKEFVETVHEIKAK